ncbi:hypothetical protein AB0D60_35140 [Streptomyces sp. NPDC048306]|uniref:hypothetical protein n=1 Tax=Streptomyces sp. NPDC048306 TaxID=3154502 RepID=UPI0033F63A65
MDWAKHTTVFAALVAGIGLGVTAWGTLVSAQVAHDQLAQSKEQRTEESKRQASRITSWREPDATIVANRSLDPADVYLDIEAITDDNATSTTFLGTVPPCVRVRIPSSALEAHMDVDEPDNYEAAWVTSLGIIDTYGQIWKRTVGEPQWTGSAGGTLTRAEPHAYQFDILYGSEADQSNWLLNEASIDPLEDCAAGT